MCFGVVDWGNVEQINRFGIVFRFIFTSVTVILYTTPLERLSYVGTGSHVIDINTSSSLSDPFMKLAHSEFKS